MLLKIVGNMLHLLQKAFNVVNHYFFLTQRTSNLPAPDLFYSQVDELEFNSWRISCANLQNT